MPFLYILFSALLIRQKCHKTGRRSPSPASCGLTLETGAYPRVCKQTGPVSRAFSPHSIDGSGILSGSIYFAQFYYTDRPERTPSPSLKEGRGGVRLVNDAEGGNNSGRKQRYGKVYTVYFESIVETRSVISSSTSSSTFTVSNAVKTVTLFSTAVRRIS